MESNFRNLKVLVIKEPSNTLEAGDLERMNKLLDKYPALSPTRGHNLLSKKQKKFIKVALKQGMTIKSYSGRFMYGDVCPAVYVDNPTDSPVKGANWDNLGLGFVVYMQD